MMLPGLGCPCGSGTPLAGCCGPVLADPASAVRAEQLMRARYAAFATGDATFLRASWDPGTRPPDIQLDPAMTWNSLEIVDIVAGGPDDDDGIVEFRALFTRDDVPGGIHERSRFQRRHGVWHYVDGVHL